MSSHSVATWYQMSMSSSPLMLWRLPIFAPASTWEKVMAKIIFTSKCSSTLSSPASTRCCSVLLGSDILQTGMNGAFGKSQDPVTRVHTGQIIMSICTKLQSKEHVIEALVCAKLLRCVQIFVTPWTVACRDPLSMGFSRQEYYSGLPCSSPEDLQGIFPSQGSNLCLLWLLLCRQILCC